MKGAEVFGIGKRRKPPVVPILAPPKRVFATGYRYYREFGRRHHVVTWDHEELTGKRHDELEYKCLLFAWSPIHRHITNWDSVRISDGVVGLAIPRSWWNFLFFIPAATKRKLFYIRLDGKRINRKRFWITALVSALAIAVVVLSVLLIRQKSDTNLITPPEDTTTTVAPPDDTTATTAPFEDTTTTVASPDDTTTTTAPNDTTTTVAPDDTTTTTTQGATTTTAPESFSWSLSFRASPSNGSVPLNNVNLTVRVNVLNGTPDGRFRYQINCGNGAGLVRDLTLDELVLSTGEGVCGYANSGSYTATAKIIYIPTGETQTVKVKIRVTE